MSTVLDLIATLCVAWLSIDPIRVTMRNYRGPERIVGFALLGLADLVIIGAIWL